ncbi:MAG: hypothetical protein MJA31_07340 [Clostridia bacterium]|nr:hypothetical protein [Clostridia bacterium]
MRDIKGNNNNISVLEGDMNLNEENRGNIVIGTQIINNPTNKRDEIEYEVVKGKLKINRKFLSITGGILSIGGLLGLISSIITIVQSVGVGQIPKDNMLLNIMSFATIIGFTLVIFLGELKRKKIITFFPNYIFGFNIGLFNDGYISKIKINSTCSKPKCGGKLRLLYNEKEDKYYFICSRNRSQHRFEFDFTSLEY